MAETIREDDSRFGGPSDPHRKRRMAGRGEGWGEGWGEGRGEGWGAAPVTQISHQFPVPRNPHWEYSEKARLKALSMKEALHD